MHFMDDMSLAEIAQEAGTSPQAVQDMLGRTTKKLGKFEEQLGLVRKHLQKKKVVAEINKLMGDSDKEVLVRGLVESML